MRLYIGWWKMSGLLNNVLGGAGVIPVPPADFVFFRKRSFWIIQFASCRCAP